MIPRKFLNFLGIFRLIKSSRNVEQATMFGMIIFDLVYAIIQIKRGKIMLIRQEEENDYEVIYSVVKEAFGSAEHTDGNEQDLVNEIRKNEAFIPELSLVAEIEGKIVGHIMFSKAKIGDVEVLALAPLSVLPNYQRKGIGTALIKEGHRIADKLGYGYSVVLGSDKYYPKTGYLPADTFGIQPPFDVPRENFMVCRINENAPEVHGIVKYSTVFGID